MPADKNDPKYDARRYPLPIIVGQPAGSYEVIELIDAFGHTEDDWRKALDFAMDSLVERARRLGADKIVGFQYSISTELIKGTQQSFHDKTIDRDSEYNNLCVVLAYGNAVKSLD